MSLRGGSASPSQRRPLERSRGVVLRLAALFTLDSFGGGFVVPSMLALWLFRRFSFSLADAAAFFSVAVLLAGASQLLAPRLAERIGLVRTMAYTHLPANACLVLAAAASVTNVPRSLGAGLAPLFAGWLLARSDFGWPLVVAGTAKIAYDLLLPAQFRHHEPGPAAPAA